MTEAIRAWQTWKMSADGRAYMGLSAKGNSLGREPVGRERTLRADEFMGPGVFPHWRVSHDKRHIRSCVTPPPEALAVTFPELALLPWVFAEIKFDPRIDYCKTGAKSTFVPINILLCTACGVRVVNDGNHRLLQVALWGINPEITVHECASDDWLDADMKNFCRCVP